MKTLCKLTACSCVLISLLPLSALASANTELLFELRERIESQQNMNDKFYGTAPKTGEASDSYLLSRLRIGLIHRFNDEFKIKLSLQDSRAIDWAFQDSNWTNSEFGKQENNPQHDPLELGETFIEYRSPYGFLSKLGRQSIYYGNKRVFGPGAWKNSGKWVWDAARIGFKKEKNWLEAFYGKSMLHDPNQFSLDHRHGFTGGALYAHMQLDSAWALEPMLISKYNDSSQDYETKDLYYYGARALYKGKGIKLDATYLQQKGHVRQSGTTRIQSNAIGYHLDLDYRFNPRWLLGAIYAYASGDDKNTAENERFDGVYGASDKYYGRMNLMAWSNLKDLGLLANYRPNRDWQVQAEYHQFHADRINDKWRAYKTGLQAQSDHYGNELDLTAQYHFAPSWKFAAGVGLFLPGEAIRQAIDNNQPNLSDDPAYSGFFQVEYKFKQTL
ncbi:alginate export family protein [Thiomicrorhabdus sp.]|uniref:alginate export family protein n=1 Tax=Thiomicrorhabdus sp. TaxID=2039724 RepID=UPI0029C6A271|nr:alginate export family protein [Thiomicrorhabdus sp.]